MSIFPSITVQGAAMNLTIVNILIACVLLSAIILAATGLSIVVTNMIDVVYCELRDWWRDSDADGS